jgi:hypothetical protein
MEEQTTVIPEAVDTTIVYDHGMANETDTAAMIRLNCFDLPDDKSEQFVPLVYFGYGKYISGAGFDVMKNYFISNVLDTTSKIESYVDQMHLKQRYFFFVYNNLPTFVDRKERHSGYYADANESRGEESKLFAYAIYRMDRSPENIRRVYKLLSPYLTEYVNFKLYVDLGIKQSIHSLLDTYQYIQTIEHSGAQLDSVYFAVDSVAAAFDYEAPSSYGHSLNSDYDIYTKYLGLDKYYDAHQESYEAAWAFSFWVRRHHEKNEQAVYEILKDLKEVYGVQN